MRSSSVPNRLPSSSRRSSTQSTSKTPAKAPEATIGGVKRAPSSLVQHTSSSGRLVRTRRSSSVRSTRRPPALPGPISPERMTVDQNRGASIVIASDADMAHALPARSGLTPARESLSTALTAADDRRIWGAMADAVPAELRAKVLARIDDDEVVRLACDLIQIGRAHV